VERQKDIFALNAGMSEPNKSGKAEILQIWANSCKFLQVIWIKIFNT